MKKILVLLAVGLLSASAIVAQESKRVLFVGNSYTAVNDLPSLVKNVCESAGESIDYQSNTPGGTPFSQHCTNNSMTLIRQGGWDVVVLQGQSQEPSFPWSQVSNETFPYAQRLVDSVYANSECPEPMFYMTWGRKNGDSYNAQFFDSLATYTGMDNLLYDRYMYMGRQYEASVCPVGRVWRYLRDNNFEIELYQSDESHPSPEGSYVAACAFYTMIFRANPLAITYDYTLDASTAETIRNVVKLVVYDSIDTYLRQLRPASIEAAVLNAESNPYERRFSLNAYTPADSYSWSFGDGQTSTDANPVHVYDSVGSYNVQLVYSRRCTFDTISLVVEIDTTSPEPGPGPEGIDEVLIDNVVIAPNPARNEVSVSLSAPAEVRLCDAMGRVVAVKKASAQTSFNLAPLPNGVYFVVVNGVGHKLLKY